MRIKYAHPYYIYFRATTTVSLAIAVLSLHASHRFAFVLGRAGRDRLHKTLASVHHRMTHRTILAKKACILAEIPLKH